MSELDADLKLIDWKGEPVVDDSPMAILANALAAIGKQDKLLEARNLLGIEADSKLGEVSLGSFVARYVSQGWEGMDSKDHPACFSLAVRLQEGGRIELTSGEVTIIKTAISQHKLVMAWVKGLITYLLDPADVGERDRAVMDRIYGNGAKVLESAAESDA